MEPVGHELVHFDVARAKQTLANIQQHLNNHQTLKSMGIKIPHTVRPSKHGFVYFIQAENSLIKIGWATDPLMRLAALQTGSPQHLSLIGCIRGDKKKEGELHRLFKHLKISGEWFASDDNLIQYIKEMDCRSDYGIKGNRLS